MSSASTLGLQDVNSIPTLDLDDVAMVAYTYPEDSLDPLACETTDPSPTPPRLVSKGVGFQFAQGPLILSRTIPATRALSMLKIDHTSKLPKLRALENAT